MLALNFFFLPPVGTFTIADPQNWVALVAFLAAAVIASQLSAAAQARARDAVARRNELARLYDLSRDVLLTTESDERARRARAARRAPLRAGTALAICLPAAGRLGTCIKVASATSSVDARALNVGARARRRDARVRRARTAPTAATAA